MSLDRGCWRGRAERWLQLEPAWNAWWKDGAIRVGLEVGRDVRRIRESLLVPYEAWQPAAVLATPQKAMGRRPSGSMGHGRDDGLSHSSSPTSRVAEDARGAEFGERRDHEHA